MWRPWRVWLICVLMAVVPVRALALWSSACAVADPGPTATLHHASAAATGDAHDRHGTTEPSGGGLATAHHGAAVHDCGADSGAGTQCSGGGACCVVVLTSRVDAFSPAVWSAVSPVGVLPSALSVVPRLIDPPPKAR